MRDVDRALSDIANIRRQLAAGTMFRGFGPAVMAATGVLALATAGAQTVWPAVLAPNPLILLGCWIVTAVVAAALIGAETLARTRRHHGGLADAMLWSAIQQFLPAGFAGMAVALVLAEFAPEALWVLPGLWQVFVALGIFAFARSMPPMVSAVGGWYFLAGLGTMAAAAMAGGLSPWHMGLPFAVGQFLLAAVLHFASGGQDGETE